MKLNITAFCVRDNQGKIHPMDMILDTDQDVYIISPNKAYPDVNLIKITGIFFHIEGSTKESECDKLS